MRPSFTQSQNKRDSGYLSNFTYDKFDRNTIEHSGSFLKFKGKRILGESVDSTNAFHNSNVADTNIDIEEANKLQGRAVSKSLFSSQKQIAAQPYQAGLQARISAPVKKNFKLRSTEDITMEVIVEDQEDLSTTELL